MSSTVDITFINELNNNITLSAYADKDNVVLNVVGPKSRIEHIVTRREAERMRDILDLILKL